MRKLIPSVVYERERIGHTFSNEEMGYSVECGPQWSPSDIEVNSGENDCSNKGELFLE